MNRHERRKAAARARSIKGHGGFLRYLCEAPTAENFQKETPAASGSSCRRRSKFMDHNFLPLNDSEHKRSDSVDWASADELVGEMVTAEGKDDAVWFDANPGRNFRIRPIGRGELLTLGDALRGYIPYTAV